MCNNVHECSLTWSVPGCPDPALGPWPALISDESQLCIRSREKMHKYPNKHEEKSLENANVRPRSAFLRRYLMNESRTQENECPAEQCLLRCHHWCSGFHLIKCHMSPPVTSSLTSDWSIIRHTRLWLVETPGSLGSQFQYQGLWSAVTLLSSVAANLLHHIPTSVQILEIFQTL